jgi:hypothetical protein
MIGNHVYCPHCEEYFDGEPDFYPPHNTNGETLDD